MKPLLLASLTIHTLGLLLFGGIGIMSVREMLRPAGAGSGRLLSQTCRPVTRIGVVLVFLVTAWFGAGIAVLLAPVFDQYPYFAQSVSLVLAFLFPPMIMHVSYSETIQQAGGPRPLRWVLPIAVAYVVSPLAVSLSLAGFFGLLGLSGRTVSIGATAVLCSLFIVAGIYSGLAHARARRDRPETSQERTSRRWHAGLYLFLTLMFFPLFLSVFTGSSAGEVLRLVMVPLFPMSFVLVGTYFEDRFEFFDVLVKRGLFVLVAGALVVLHVALVVPVVDRLELGWARAWGLGVTLLPLALVLPWLYTRLARRVDRRWLNRSFSTTEAMQHFLSTLRPATSEEELVERAGAGLSEIFRTRVQVRIGPGTADREAMLAIPIRARGRSLGALQLSRRPDKVPFFSEDVVLLDSLAAILSFQLENMRLHERKKEQDRQARELSLHASRSELKALRAQINPHFLFNALNAIAGHIHRNPALADRTVEELAEVFRYTLRRSESEWARLEDELTFVRAYLQVEKARFGDRLAFEVSSPPELSEVRVPVMMIQTLTENAIKHGIAVVRDAGRVEVRAAREADGRVCITVTDNGPGFDPGRGTSGTGYGLQNIEQRLQGHFGDAAGLARTREEGRTRVTLTLPPGPEDGREPRGVEATA